MQFVKYFFLFLAILTFSIQIKAQDSNFDIVVALDGSGDFTSIQAAIDAVPDNSEEKTIILIKRGLYDSEKLYVPGNKQNIVMIGESRDETIISYHVYDCQSGGFEGKCPAEDAMLWPGENLRTSATLTVSGNGFTAENLTIQNTAGPVGQAQAITVRADKVIFRNCNLTGYQDTIYLWSDGNRTYFENCLIVGRTDYIYGGGKAFFQSCEIRSWGGGWITAPATIQSEMYGFVFYECEITYATDSPRAGDDGATVALGRPWHNYPKVAWLYCNMTEKINPKGWPDIWNMDYAPTSEDLHLYEYKNTGPGADMSNRADWVGLRALTDEEALEYTVQKVMAGNDGWDPTAEEPAVKTFNWTGEAADSSWLSEMNWDLSIVPDTGEAAIVDGPFTIIADGGYFAADLSLSNGATLYVNSDSELAYLGIGQSTISGSNSVTLSGKVRTKDSIVIESVDLFQLNTNISGVHFIDKQGAGKISLLQTNNDFNGYWNISEGTLSAQATLAFGEARSITVNQNTTLEIDAADAIYTNTPLYAFSSSKIILNHDVIISEFYIDGIIQDVGEYNSVSHPDLIEGDGSIKIGRPDTFTFIGGANGNWDNPDHFSPALLPEAGETVYTSREMETTSFIFPADIIVEAGGRIRLRGTHNATGTLFFLNGSSIAYATSGGGFTLNAPMNFEGEVFVGLNSRNENGHAMNLGGDISGKGVLNVINQRDDTENLGKLVVSGNNEQFTGTWQLLGPNGNENSIAGIEASGENALGNGIVTLNGINTLILNHERAAGDTLSVNIDDFATIELAATTRVDAAIINGEALEDGIYKADSLSFLTGEGSLLVGDVNSSVPDQAVSEYISFINNELIIGGNISSVSVFSIDGNLVINNSQKKSIHLKNLTPGIYVAVYVIDGQKGSIKIAVN